MFGVRILAPGDFSRARWWQPLRPGPTWFYHTPAPARDPVALYVTPHSLDRDLGPAVTFLHRHGIPTTPSCQGHWVNRKGANTIFDQLREDQGLIQRQGLLFEDCETRAQHVVQDPAWALPWDSGDDLFEDLRQHAGCGYIGFRHAPQHWTWDWTEWAMECLPAVQIQVSPGLTGVHVRAKSPEAQRDVWAKVHESFRDAAE